MNESNNYHERNSSINNSNDYSQKIYVGSNQDQDPYTAPKKVLNATVKGIARKDK